MIDEIELTEEEEDHVQNDNDQGVFVSGRSSFIITDDLKVSVDSTGLVLKTLNSLGCSDVSMLGEQLLDIGLSEIMCLLECVFSSNTPLTDALLKKQSSQNIHKLLLTPSCLNEAKTDVSEETEFTIDAIVRKQDMKILYVECGQDFVDLLFTFLAVHLEYVCGTSSGCIGNLRRSCKDLTVDKWKGGEASKCVLPHYYKCQKQLCGITTEEAPVYYRYRNSNPRQPDYSLTTDEDRTLLYRKDRIVAVTVIDPKSTHHGRDDHGSGFVKRGTRFTVSDDHTKGLLEHIHMFYVLFRLF